MSAVHGVGRAIEAGKNAARKIIVLNRSSMFLASAGEAVPPVIFVGRKRTRTRVHDAMGNKVTSAKTRPATNDIMIAPHGTLVVVGVLDC